MAAPQVPLPSPSPKSPPEFPDLYGKRRGMARIQMLEREIGFLEEELKSFERSDPASKSCKEVTDFVVANPDPLLPTIKKKKKSCRFWKWLCWIPCCNLSWICCCCSSHCSCHLRCPSCGNCNLCSCSLCDCMSFNCNSPCFTWPTPNLLYCCSCPRSNCCRRASCGLCSRSCCSCGFPLCSDCYCCCRCKCSFPKCPRLCDPCCSCGRTCNPCHLCF